MSVSTTAGITACELMSIQGTPRINSQISEPIGKISSTGPAAPKPPALTYLHSAVDPGSNARSRVGHSPVLGGRGRQASRIAQEVLNAENTHVRLVSQPRLVRHPGPQAWLADILARLLIIPPTKSPTCFRGTGDRHVSRAPVAA